MQIFLTFHYFFLISDWSVALFTQFILFQTQADELKYVPTQLGMATLSSALSPDEALVVFAEVQKARKCFVLESELHIIYQVSEK